MQEDRRTPHRLALRLLTATIFSFIFLSARIFVHPSCAADDALNRLFEQVLRDPTNSAFNLNYAKAAIEQGELRKALAAYERVLAVDPKNEDARLGMQRLRRLLEPDATSLVFAIGPQFESNPGHNSGRQDSKTYDYVTFGRAQLIDQRRIENMRWRTETDLFANSHARHQSLDYGIISV
ncbi:MAG: tetratricopeptide repeat protein, partial [Alphaproteobacteria bacterium]